MPQLFDPDMWERGYKTGDPLRPIGNTTTIGGDLVRKWSYDVIDGTLDPVWPPRRHTVRMGPDGVERTIRIIYDHDSHSIITRTVADCNSDVASNSFDLQRQAFLAVGENDPELRWMPDGGRYVQGKTEIALFPPSERDLLIKRAEASTPQSEV
jgi:hypothetical protein